MNSQGLSPWQEAHPPARPAACQPPLVEEDEEDEEDENEEDEDEDDHPDALEDDTPVGNGRGRHRARNALLD